MLSLPFIPKCKTLPYEFLFNFVSSCLFNKGVEVSPNVNVDIVDDRKLEIRDDQIKTVIVYVPVKLMDKTYL